MKIVFFGYDQSLDIAQRLIADGHDIVAIQTFPCDNMFAFNTQTQAFAQHFNIPISSHKITAQEIESLIQLHGAEVFLVCGYPYKVPPIPHNRAYGINLHPALLPRVRGIMPLPYIIMHEPDAAGLTLHKLTDGFDAGDIIAQIPLKLGKSENVDLLNARLGIAAPDFVARTLQNLSKLWENATPQDHANASHYSAPTQNIRTLDFSQNTQDLHKLLRAFGRFGAFATIHNDMGQSQNFIVYQAHTWQESHNIPAGRLIKSSPREIIITVNDGYICLNEFQVIS